MPAPKHSRSSAASDSNRARAYLDTSALVKLVIVEAETDALRQALHRWPRRVASEIAVVELLRVARRQVPNAEAIALDVLSRLSLYRLTRRTLLRAGRLEPARLRSLDAIHLATALQLVPDVTAFFTYDHRLQEAARQAGLEVYAPAP